MYIRTILPTTLSCVLAAMITVPSFGQMKELTMEEIMVVINAAEAKLATTAYRSREITGTNTGKDEMNLRYDQKELVEFEPPNKFRIFTEEWRGSWKWKWEQIWDGKKYYIRKDNGPWKVSDGQKNKVSNFDPDIKKLTHKLEFIKDTELDGEKTAVYKITTERVDHYKTAVFLQKPRRYKGTTTFWISEKGFLLKIFKTLLPYNVFIRQETTITYEYNPIDLKIEAPIK